jgi:16S rRNA (cytosine967-C5)-methyltransferase
LAKAKEPAGLKLRLVAIERLRSVLGGGAFAPLSAAEIADGRDRALANKLVNTALRRHGHLNLIIADLLDKGMPGKSGSFEAVLRLSLSQLLFLPEIGAHSAIFLAVEALKADKKAQHLTGLMNAVLRRAQGAGAKYWDMPEHLLFPIWLRESWSAAYGEDVLVPFGEALLAGAPLDLTLRDDDPELIEVLGAERVAGDSVRVINRDRAVEALPGYDEGRWWVQDAAAALPARLIGVAAGSRVLDLCAAPGGKTAQLVKAGYRVTALDDDAGRLERLGANLERVGYSAEIVTADAATYKPEVLFDAVLLDAPCSATGIFRRHPEVVWHRAETDIAGRVALQRRMLANAAACLNPGGVLIYCVCSLEGDEGEGQARWIAEARSDLEPVPITPDELDGGLASAVTEAGFVRTHSALEMPVAGGIDGFFIARFRKR